MVVAVAVEEATEKSEDNAVPVVLSATGVATESSAAGAAVPTPKLLLPLFQKRLDAPPNELLLLN